MCGGPEHQKQGSSSSSMEKMVNTNRDLTVEISEDSFSNLLELAANNDLEAFKRIVDEDVSKIDEIGLWYGRQKGSKQMVLEHRTPLMVASIYGSIDVMKLILSLSGDATTGFSGTADVNRSCGPDRSTALHCAASGGSIYAVEAVRLLLFAGADPNCVDANGRRPCDVIMVSPKLPLVRTGLEDLLNGDRNFGLKTKPCGGVSDSMTSSPPLSSSPDGSSSSSMSSPTSPVKLSDIPAGKPFSAGVSEFSEKKEYPVDPSLPDIKNSIYTTDEFRMFSFKVRPCSRAYSHDWTECPFVHPGENARRRDPRKFHYSCVPCPDFRKGACRRGDLCEYAHGVFECWLHPAQYRTRLCKDGTSCMRRVCFFAHTSDELRPLFVSTGSAVPSPRSSAALEMAAVAAAAAAMSMPGSPSSLMSPSPFSLSNPATAASVLTPPMSPSSSINGLGHSSIAWPQPNVPTLHLPGSNLQSSRLRSSLSARDIPADDFSVMSEFDAQQLLNEYACFSSAQSRMNSAASTPGRAARSKTLTPSNLDDLFSAELSSPRFSDQAVFSPKASMFSPIQQQQTQNSNPNPMLSPVNTNVFSQKSVDSQLSGHSLLQASFGLSSPGRMSPRSVDIERERLNSGMGSHPAMNTWLSAIAQREKQQQQLRSHSARDLSGPAAAATAAAGMVGSPASPWSKWGSPTGKLDWGVQGDELGRLRRSSSFELNSGNEEPDLSWVQSLVKESPPEVNEKPASSSSSSNENSGSSQLDAIDHTVLGAWLEQMQLDQLVA